MATRPRTFRRMSTGSGLRTQGDNWRRRGSSGAAGPTPVSGFRKEDAALSICEPWEPGARDHGQVVAVLVNDTESWLDAVLLAAEEADSRMLPLELIQLRVPDRTSREQRAHQMERLDRALAVARMAVPGIDVRVRYTGQVRSSR